MLREVIKIDEGKCDGCGQCVPACNEGAIQIIDGKARLISDLFCDGLGACIGFCPQDAITIEKRIAEPYNEFKVMEVICQKPDNVIKAHLMHLFEHNELEYLNQALEFLSNHNKEINIEFAPLIVPIEVKNTCPGSKMIELNVIKSKAEGTISAKDNNSMLNQWPVQLHLVNPNASFFKGKELVIMSTCAPLASGNIHKEYLDGRTVVVACPKLDDTTTYIDKLSSIFRIGGISKAIIVRMEVPCCGGLSKMSFLAAERADSKIILEEHTLNINGNVINKHIIYPREN